MGIATSTAPFSLTDNSITAAKLASSLGKWEKLVSSDLAGIANKELTLASYTLYEYYCVICKCNGSGGLRLTFNQDGGANYNKTATSGGNAIASTAAATYIEINDDNNDQFIMFYFHRTKGSASYFPILFNAASQTCTNIHAIHGSYTGAAATITHVKLTNAGGNFTDGTMILYGIN